LYYLAWTIPPLILGLLAVPASFSRQHRRTLTVIVWSILIVLTLSALELSTENYFTAKARSFAKAKLMRRYNGDSRVAMGQQGLLQRDINGDSVWITSDVAELLESAEAMDQNLIRKDDLVLAAPYLAGLYPVWQKPSPLWQIYFLLPRPQPEQEKMVEELERKRVNWALVCHNYVDDRPDLAFKKTHAFLWHYLARNFERVQTAEIRQLGNNCELMRRLK
jgi:hypothetical protein